MFEGACTHSDVITVICGALFLVSELLGGTERVRPNTVLGALKAAALRVVRRGEPEPEPPPEQQRRESVQAIGPHHVDIQMTQTEAPSSCPGSSSNSTSTSTSTAFPWLLRTYARKKQQQPKEPAEMAADLDRCTRRAIASYAKRVEQYHPQMAEDARAYAKNPAASPPVMAAVIDRLQWALHEEGERVRNFFMPNDSRYLGSLLTLGAVAYMSPARYYLVRILAAQFAGYYFVGPYLLNGLRKA
eukprot:tig00020941_g16210.t1